MRKKIFGAALLLSLACLSITSCKDENDDGNISDTTYEFSVKEEDNTINAPADGKEYVILVASTKTAQAGTSHVDYKIVSAPEWAPAELEQTSLIIRVAQNSSATARGPEKVVLEQLESEKKLELTVHQSGYANAVSLEAAYSTERCKILVIEPTISGYDQNPIYQWTVKGADDKEAIEAGSEKNLSFIKLKTGEYTVSLTVSDDSGMTDIAETKVTVKEEENPYSHYISEVLEYRPALLNDKGLRFGPNDTYNSVLQGVNDKLKNANFSEREQGVNLGAFGGYIVFRFDHTIMNVDGLRDFRIGHYNSKMSYPGQGVVYVSFDANNNGQADDEWYEIAGSEYGKTNVRTGLKIEYTRPSVLKPNAAQEKWVSYSINSSENGSFCYAQAMWGSQISYWPIWLQNSEEGAQQIYSDCVMLPPIAQAPGTPSGYPSSPNPWYEYGYVCNSDPKDEVGSSFDIDWARDKEGKAVKLPGIDFIKVQNATLQDLGYNYGPACVLINSAIDLHLEGKEIPSKPDKK